MSFTIEAGWWLAPFTVSVAGFIAAWVMTKGETCGGWIDLSGFFTMVTYLIVFVVPSLVTWLIWAVTK